MALSNYVSTNWMDEYVGEDLDDELRVHLSRADELI
jgi:hypothetical protein